MVFAAKGKIFHAFVAWKEAVNHAKL